MNDLLPIYHQVKEVIKRWIDEGVYGPGEKIPSEAELIEAFGVSKLTVRQAVGLLVKEGFLISKRGKGSFVTSDTQVLDGLTQKHYGSIEDMFYHKVRLKTRYAEVSRFPASPLIKKRLRLGPNENTVIEAFRVRHVEDKPIVVTKSYLPLKYGLLLDKEKLLKQHLIMGILESEAGVRFKRFYQGLEATFADKNVADLLKVPTGTPILLVERLLLAARLKPVFLALSWFRADIFKYLESYRIIKKNDRVRLISEGFDTKAQKKFW